MKSRIENHQGCMLGKFIVHACSCIYSVNAFSKWVIDLITLFRTWWVESWPGSRAGYAVIPVTSEWYLNICVCIYLCLKMSKCFAKMFKCMKCAIAMITIMLMYMNWAWSIVCDIEMLTMKMCNCYICWKACNGSGTEISGKLLIIERGC